ncbi:hypothetical protein AVEN_128387-1 [Araneus ventricosus]|uniref:RNase H type-1 domain-containing protein n=1 Tax=Araneus ventricosus TaxID=182803 RepID=A0A4Y2GWW7_ARAVE|nr:hypothetical protein AVEN_128387-1 [Araneus ventricosus]
MGKLNGRVGSGVVCLSEDRDIIWKLEIRLNDEASVFIAEAVAIQMAAEKVGPTKEKIVIFSDSKSVLMALESNKNHSEVIMKLRKILLVNPQITLNWVRAHIDIYGNELADLSAKNATTKEEVDIMVKIPMSWITNQLKMTMVQEWQARWMSSPNSRFLYGIFPEVNTKRCHGDFLINQILTTHGCFPVHQHRIFGKSPDCKCGRDQGTVFHYVYGCQIYRVVRQKYFPENFFQLGILELILNTRGKIGLKIIIQDVLTKSLAGVASSS